MAREKELNQRIAADKKPYFFTYRYSDVKKAYDKFIKSVEANAKRRYNATLNDLLEADGLDAERSEFLQNCQRYLPVSAAPGVMNRICWLIENEFRTQDVLPDVEFDYSVLKGDAEYSDDEYLGVAALFDRYNSQMQLYMKGQRLNENSGCDVELEVLHLKRTFVEMCAEVCPDEQRLANIVIDLCYGSNKAKTFAWDVCGEQIWRNVLKKNGGVMYYPCKDETGEMLFAGERYTVKTLEVVTDDCVE